MPFRITAKLYFLTYPQCDIPIQRLMDFLWTVKNKEPRLLVVASEQHADGNLHRHAYLEFKERVDVTNERLFDFEGFHPSIEKGRNARNILKYCTKEGDYAIRGDKEHFD